MDGSPPTAICPPHHWMIGSVAGSERWSCQRCGLVRQNEGRVVQARRLANVATWSRDEMVLVGALDD